ncbi:hypothetical protein BHE74_00016024 [Ensete ventricosum]|nr:hypothetical protein BHE74_00016024 [Ensete ventricosum]RZR87448.1 hypothetical protein BHM03_00014852 [Ensete ventricosum]
MRVRECGGSPWQDQARALQLRIRDRFRVAVDRRRRWHLESDYSMTLQRWFRRVLSVWEDQSPGALASPVRFYRKKASLCLSSIPLFNSSIDVVVVVVLGGYGLIYIFYFCRLVIDADNVPFVIPFVHTGMQEIMPIGANFPRIGKQVTVLIGDPIFLDDLLVDKDDPQHVSTGILYDAVSSRIGHRLQELKVQVDRLALEQPFEARDYYSVHDREYGCRIWQQVDWEAFGIENYMLEERSQISNGVADDQPMRIHDRSHTTNSPRVIRMGFFDEGGIISRIRGYMNPSELMGFAARGLFINGRIRDESRETVRDVSPLKAWKQFLEGNMFHQWNGL